jgi:hypothetical protein
MPVEVEVEDECFWAQGAYKIPFVAVDHHMLGEMAFLHGKESKFTIIFFECSYFLSFKKTCLKEGLVTDGAFVRSFAGVRHAMLLEQLARAELFAALV